MKTETLILLVVVAAVGVYFVTRPKTAVTYPPGVQPYGTTPVYNPYLQQQPNQVAQDITAGGIAAGGIADIISALNFGGDSNG